MGVIRGERSVEIEAPVERCYEIAVSLEGSWTFEDLGGERSRATYALVADPGRMLGMLLRGPAEAKVRDFLLGGAAEGLEAHAESGAS